MQVGMAYPARLYSDQHLALPWRGDRNIIDHQGLSDFMQNCGSHMMVTPPSITIVCPVIQRPAREARNTAAPAISPGSPMRRSGVRFSVIASNSGFSHNARAKSVRTKPGAMQFTRILKGPHSTA